MNYKFICLPYYKSICLKVNIKIVTYKKNLISFKILKNKQTDKQHILLYGDMIRLVPVKAYPYTFPKETFLGKSKGFYSQSKKLKI